MIIFKKTKFPLVQSSCASLSPAFGLCMCFPLKRKYCRYCKYLANWNRQWCLDDFSFSSPV